MELRGVGPDGMTEVPMSPPNPDPRAPEAHAVEPVEDPTEKPVDGDRIKLAKYYVLLPLYIVSKYTIPGMKKHGLC